MTQPGRAPNSPGVYGSMVGSSTSPPEAAMATSSYVVDLYGEKDGLLLSGESKAAIHSNAAAVAAGRKPRLNRVLSLLVAQIIFMSLIALAALLFMNESSSLMRKLSSAASTATSNLLESAGLSGLYPARQHTMKDVYSGHTNSDKYTYTFTTMENTPTYVYATASGKYVFVADSHGHIYRSHDYGATFKWSKPFLISSSADGSDDGGVYASLFGMVMTKSGKRIIASTGSYGNYMSKDYGESWHALSSQTCSLMAASSDLVKVICIGGTLEHKNHLYISLDSGLSWDKTASQGFWKGVSASDNFSNLLAIVYTGCGYVYHSQDEGSSWTRTDSDESCTLKWGCLSVSSDTKTLLLTDVITRNVHASADRGYTWYQVFAASTFKLQANVTINACAVSADGTAFAIGFTGSQIRTSFNCDFSKNLDAHCTWVDQDRSSANTPFNTSAIAFSKDGSYIFSADKTTAEIAVGAMD